MSKIILIKASWLTSLTLLVLSMSSTSFAKHFHYFIDIETTFSVDQNKQLKSLDISWVYDKKMSALMKKQNPNLRALGQATINDLRKNHYFMNVQFNGRPVKTGQVKQFSLQEFSDEKGAKAIQLDFTLPLVKPLDMKGKNQLTWNFADPSGLAIMVYYTPQNIRLGKQLKTHCKASMRDNEKADHGKPEQLLTLNCTL